MSTPTVPPKRTLKETLILRLLDRIEKSGNAMPDPAVLFIIFAIIVIIASHICANLGLSVSFDTYDAAKKAMVQKQVHAVSLLSPDGIRFMVSTVIPNFTGFVALGPVFVAILGVGVAEGTGFIGVLLKKLAQVTPRKLVTPVLIFLGIMSHMASSTGYVVLIPLGAILFMSLGRHPIAGLATAFAGVAGGWSANIVLATADPALAGMTAEAAKIINPAYPVLPTANWYFTAASSLLIITIGTWVTEKIVEPALGPYKSEETATVSDITADEKRGIKFAVWGALIYLAIVAALVVPEGAILRNPATGVVLQSPFMSGIIFFMMLFFLIPGLLYGIGAKVIKNDKEAVAMMSNSISKLSGFMVLLFFAAQFVAYFNYSNLGTIISVSGANFLKSTGFVGVPLILVFIVFTALVDIVFAVDTAKWAIMAPIFVPMFMHIGLSPELTQMAYRIGDSTSNVISPLMPFFPLIVAFCEKYDKKAGIGTLVSTMLPYSLAFLIGWTALLIVWYMLNLPLGPGAPIHYPIH